MVTPVRLPHRRFVITVLENVCAGSYHALTMLTKVTLVSAIARETTVPAVIANNRTAVLLFTALLMALAVAATVMLAKHGVAHTGALAAKPSVYFDG
jgi:hypothetical protein